MPDRRALILAPLYDGTYYPHLPGAKELVKRLQACLTQHGNYEVKPKNEIVKRKGFLPFLRELCDSTGEILFYFYGHGAVRNNDVGLFVTSDGEPDDEGVLMSEAISQAFNCSAREVVFILDCCHAGAASPAAEDSVRRAAEHSGFGRVLLAGCAAHQNGWITENTEQKKVGVFSWHVLRGLEGAARLHGSPHVRGSSLGLYVTDQFRAWNQSPLFLPRETGDRLCIITSGFSEEQKARQGRQPLVLGIPFMPSRLFVGRKAEVETLRSILAGGPKPIAVSATVEGLGGIGKTELVLQLIRDPGIEEAFDTIVWLDGAGPLPPQWQKVASGLGVTLQATEPEQLVSEVAGLLRKRGRTLLVLDNATDWGPAERLIPHDMALLVTTRTRDFGGNSFRQLELEILADEAATSLLVQMAPRLKADIALSRLVATLGGHALALEIAGGTIDALGLSAAEYLERLRQKRTTPSEILKAVKHGKTVDECLTLTWASLKHDASRSLWRHAALFAPTSAHRDLLRVSFVGDDQTREEIQYLYERGNLSGIDEAEMAGYEPGMFDEAYAELRSRNVFARIEESQGERWSIHRLVRDFGRSRLKPGDFTSHAMALSEWLRNPTLDLQPEIPHFVVAILDSAQFGNEFQGRFGRRSHSRELYTRTPILFDSDYFLTFIREELRDPRALSMLLDGLVDINSDVRAQAIRILERLGHIPEVLDGVISALDDPDLNVRLTARRTIAEHGSGKVIEILRKTLESTRPRARLEATRCLAMLGEQARPVLQEALTSEDAEVRYEAALSLAEQGCGDGQSTVVEAASNSADEANRVRALRALGSLKDTHYYPIIRTGLESPRADIKRAAVEAIRQLGSPEHAEEVVRLLLSGSGASATNSEVASLALDLASQYKVKIPLEVAQRLLEDDRWNIRERCARVLGEAGVTEAVGLLTGKLKDTDFDVRREAVAALGKLGDPSVRELIATIAISDSDESVKTAARQALTQFGGSSVDAAELLKQGSTHERQAGAESLKTVEGSDAVGVLLLALGDPEAEVRRAVVTSLGFRGSPTETSERLKPLAASDPEESVRFAASAALVRQRCLAAGRDRCPTADLIDGKHAIPPDAIIDLLERYEGGNLCGELMRLLVQSVASGRSSYPAAAVVASFKENFTSDDASTRRFAAWTVGLLRAKDAIPDLIPLLQDDSVEVRLEVAQALGLLAEPSAMEALARATEQDSEQTVRDAACSSLAQLRDSVQAQPNDSKSL